MTSTCLRQSLGEQKITYFGYSYGTFLGSTYASMFPTHYRAMVLDGPVDADAYINDPMRDLSAQTSGFERALGRFFQACAADQAACRGFGGERPVGRLRRADRPGSTPTRLPVGDARHARRRRRHPGTAAALYSKANWPRPGQGAGRRRRTATAR